MRHTRLQLLFWVVLVAAWNVNDVPAGYVTRCFYDHVTRRLISNRAVLAVNADTVPPSIVSATTLGYDTFVQVVFSEPVTPATAGNKANYSIPGVTVNSATLQSDGITVWLLTSKMDLTKVQTLTVNGVKDFAATPNTGNNLIAQLGLVPGTITRKYFLNIAGSSVPNLTGAATFPNQPDIVEYVASFEGRTDWADNYGTYVQGWLVPDATDNYTLAIASDDSSELWLSTDDNPAHMDRIAFVNGWSSSRGYNGAYSGGGAAVQQSAPIRLTEGKRYYVQALQKEGIGGDHLTVAWQRGGGTIADGTAPISGNHLIPWIDPAVPLAITAPPQSQTVVELRDATFSLSVVGTPRYTGIQWYRDGKPISGANSLSCTLATVKPGDNGAVFSVVVSNLVYTATTSNAVLTVISDNVPPTLAGTGSLDGDAVVVVFSELLEKASAENKANYAVTGASVTNATLNADGKSVLLALSGKVTEGYQLTISGVKDLAGNVIAASSQITGGLLGLTIENINNSQPLSVSYAGNIAIVAGGADIWNNADQFVYAYTTETGDFDYQLDVNSIAASDPWAKCGLMARASTAAGSRHIFNCVTPEGGNNYYNAQWRPDLCLARAIGQRQLSVRHFLRQQLGVVPRDR